MTIFMNAGKMVMLQLQQSALSVDTDLAGKTDLDQARADMIVDCLEDLTKPLLIVMREQDETKKVQYFS